jgi:hypothetical protein
MRLSRIQLFFYVHFRIYESVYVHIDAKDFSQFSSNSCNTSDRSRSLSLACNRVSTASCVCFSGSGQSPPFRDHLQMAIALCGRTQFAAGYGRRTRRYHHLDVIAVRRDRLVGGAAITRTIGRRPYDLAIDLIEQRR